MKRIILTKEQLNEYVEKKKAEKVFYRIIEDLHKSQKLLKESVSKNDVKQTIIDNYKRKNLITPKVFEMLTKYGIMTEKYKII